MSTRERMALIHQTPSNSTCTNEYVSMCTNQRDYAHFLDKKHIQENNVLKDGRINEFRPCFSTEKYQEEIQNYFMQFSFNLNHYTSRSFNHYFHLFCTIVCWCLTVSHAFSTATVTDKKHVEFTINDTSTVSSTKIVAGNPKSQNLLYSYDGPTIKLAALVSHTGFLSDISIHIERGYTLAQDWINNDMGGILFNGQFSRLEIETFDDQSSPDVVERLLPEIIKNDSDYSFILGPHTSTLAEKVVDKVAKSNVIQICPTASDERLFNGQHTFGIVPPSRSYLRYTLPSLSSVGLRTAIMLVQEGDRFHEAACSFSAFQTSTYELPKGDMLPSVPTLSYIANISIPMHGTEPDVPTLSRVLEMIRQHDPDLLVGCISYEVCKPLVLLAEERNINIRNAFFTLCASDARFRSEMIENDYKKRGRYLFGQAIWDPRLPTDVGYSRSHVCDTGDFWRPSEFYVKYYERYQVVPPYQAALAFASVEVAYWTMREANNLTNISPLLEYLRVADYSTIMGPVSFDKRQQNTDATIMVLQYNADDEYNIISPDYVSTSSAILSAPTWAKRDCIRLEYCDQGHCTDSGGCNCNSGYIGGKCDSKISVVVVGPVLFIGVIIGVCIYTACSSARKLKRKQKFHEKREQDRQMMDHAARETHSRILSYALHELANPLFAVSGTIELMHAEQEDGYELTPKQRARQLAIVRTKVRQMQRVLKDMQLSRERIVSGKLQITAGPTDLTSILRDVQHRLRRVHDVHIDIHFDDTSLPSRIGSDPLRCQQLLTDAVANLAAIIRRYRIMEGHDSKNQRSTRNNPPPPDNKIIPGTRNRQSPFSTRMYVSAHCQLCAVSVASTVETTEENISRRRHIVYPLLQRLDARFSMNNTDDAAATANEASASSDPTKAGGGISTVDLAAASALISSSSDQFARRNSTSDIHERNNKTSQLLIVPCVVFIIGTVDDLTKRLGCEPQSFFDQAHAMYNKLTHGTSYGDKSTISESQSRPIEYRRMSSGDHSGRSIHGSSYPTTIDSGSVGSDHYWMTPKAFLPSTSRNLSLPPTTEFWGNSTVITTNDHQIDAHTSSFPTTNVPIHPACTPQTAELAYLSTRVRELLWCDLRRKLNLDAYMGYTIKSYLPLWWHSNTVEETNHSTSDRRKLKLYKQSDALVKSSMLNVMLNSADMPTRHLAANILKACILPPKRSITQHNDSVTQQTDIEIQSTIPASIQNTADRHEFAVGPAIDAHSSSRTPDISTPFASQINRHEPTTTPSWHPTVSVSHHQDTTVWSQTDDDTDSMSAIQKNIHTKAAMNRAHSSHAAIGSSSRHLVLTPTRSSTILPKQMSTHGDTESESPSIHSRPTSKKSGSAYVSMEHGIASYDTDGQSTMHHLNMETPQRIQTFQSELHLDMTEKSSANRQTVENHMKQLSLPSTTGSNATQWDTDLSPRNQLSPASFRADRNIYGTGIDIITPEHIGIDASPFDQELHRKSQTRQTASHRRRRRRTLGTTNASNEAVYRRATSANAIDRNVSKTENNSLRDTNPPNVSTAENSRIHRFWDEISSSTKHSIAKSLHFKRSDKQSKKTAEHTDPHNVNSSSQNHAESGENITRESSQTNSNHTNRRPRHFFSRSHNKKGEKSSGNIPENGSQQSSKPGVNGTHRRRHYLDWAMNLSACQVLAERLGGTLEFSADSPHMMALAVPLVPDLKNGVEFIAQLNRNTFSTDEIAERLRLLFAEYDLSELSALNQDAAASLSASEESVQDNQPSSPFNQKLDMTHSWQNNMHSATVDGPMDNQTQQSIGIRTTISPTEELVVNAAADVEQMKASPADVEQMKASPASVADSQTSHLNHVSVQCSTGLHESEQSSNYTTVSPKQRQNSTSSRMSKPPSSTTQLRNPSENGSTTHLQNVFPSSTKNVSPALVIHNTNNSLVGDNQGMVSNCEIEKRTHGSSSKTNGNKTGQLTFHEATNTSDHNTGLAVHTQKTNTELDISHMKPNTKQQANVIQSKDIIQEKMNDTCFDASVPSLPSASHTLPAQPYTVSTTSNKNSSTTNNQVDQVSLQSSQISMITTQPSLSVTNSVTYSSSFPIQNRSQLVHKQPELPLRVLVCDDERLNVKLVSRMLKRLGCTVAYVYDGDEIIPFLESLQLNGEEPYDVLLLDIVMKRTNGIDTCRELLALQHQGNHTEPNETRLQIDPTGIHSSLESRYIPRILAMTANCTREDLELYEESGFLGCVPKPFTISDVKQILIQVCEDIIAERQE